jgi:hypothetical protein
LDVLVKQTGPGRSELKKKYLQKMKSVPADPLGSPANTMAQVSIFTYMDMAVNSPTGNW